MNPPDGALDVTGELYLILSPSLEIMAGSDAYLEAAGTVPVIGRHIVDVFTEHPEMPGAAGVRHLRESITRAVETRLPDRVSAESHATFLADGTAEERYWTTSNAPVFDSAGKLLYIVHRDQDVTAEVVAARTADEKRVAAAARAEQQARVFDTTLSGIADFAYIFDRQGRFIYANKALLDLWGLTLEEAIHKDFYELNYPTELAEKLQRQVEHVFATGEVLTDETPYTSPSGMAGFYEYIFTPVRGHDGTVDVVAGSTRVMTVRKAVEQERERLLEKQQQLQAKNEQLLAAERSARTEAERVAHIKDEFLATLSHELRTPLNAILGWSQLLRRRTGDPAGFDEGLVVIERNAHAQKQLIEDLLDMSGIVSGKVRLEIQRVSLADVIRNAVATVQPAADAKRITLTTLLDTVVGPASGDPTRLQQVVWNLLSNAIKFTPKEGQIAVVLERSASHVAVSVRDTGQGIRPEFLPYVFERFRQSDASTTRRHGGLGLGLSIVKTLVEMHGGEVSVESEGEGTGSTFIVRLPLTITKASTLDVKGQRSAAPVSQAFACDPHLLAGVKVLVVDDEVDGRTLVGRILEECGSEVRLAGSAAEALALFQSFSPDVVISDIGMPDTDGYELIGSIRSLGEKGRAVPAAALTALARPEDRTMALLAGYQTHIAKPIEPMELIATAAALAKRTGL